MENQKFNFMTNSDVISEQAFAVFTLIDVTNALIVEMRDAHIGDFNVLQHGLSELGWLEANQQDIHQHMSSIIAMYPQNLLTRHVESSLEKDKQNINTAYRTLNRVSMEAIQKPQTSEKGRKSLVRNLENLAYSLNHTHMVINSLKEGLHT